MTGFYRYGGRTYKCKYRYGYKTKARLSEERLAHIADVVGVAVLCAAALCVVLLWGAEVI